eukprot:CCRYP_007732-RA/>CCRYP_007732-RA protein AED:0.04 eAED:0.04 QI:151/1/1/1/1/1/8/72/1904
MTDQPPNDNKENHPFPRTPLLHRVPFAPSPTNLSARKDITPAYAYKNRDTGLLEISNKPPRLSLVADEDSSVVGLEHEVRSPKLALYPIALNGGGAGLYSDPREFGGRNIEESVYLSGRKAERRGNVRFAWPAEKRGVLHGNTVGNHVPVIANGSAEGREEEEGMETIDLEVGTLHQQPRPIVHQPLSRLSFTSLDPWRIWSTLHTELSRIAAARTSRLEEEASHVTLAKQKNLASSKVISSVYNQDDFDFALVLSSNDAYAFWARYLDFRDEALCYCYPENDDEGDGNDADDCSTIATNQHVTMNPSDNEKNDPYTPLDSSGLRRRRTNHAPHSSCNNSENALSSSKMTTPSQHHTPFSSLSPNPKQSMIRSSQKRTTFHQKSLFERAVDRFSPTRFSIGTPQGTSRHNITSAATSGTSTPQRETPERKDVYSTGGKLRRRWGNQDYDTNKLSTPNLTSPPIVSLKSRRMGSTARKNWKVSSSGKKTLSLRTKRGLLESAERLGKRVRETMMDGGVGSTDENEEDNFFSSPGIPRGVAARVNGLGQFLEALEIGIVVRRHWPRGKSVFILLYSDNKGDTIHYRYIPDDEAVIALREQEQRYNGRRRNKRARISFGVNEPRRDSDSAIHNDIVDASVPLPDYLKAKIDRDEDNRKKGGIRNTITHSALRWLNTGMIAAADIVQVHPASHVDPYARDGNKLGTQSLRQSETKYVKNNAFSVILPSVQGSFVQKHFPSIDLGEKWCEGEHQSLFRCFDIELATEGEYWMVLRGFLLLHRDASTGRFSAQRAGLGFGSHHRYALENDRKDNTTNQPGVAPKARFAEVLPSHTKPTLLNKMIRMLIDEKETETEENIAPYMGVPPPSDYVLGFSSPGTQIWGRLRQAGLETQRIYALDTRKVMIKVRCPVDRLQDVAEALKLKLKTKDGDFAPYREDLITHFVPTNDGQISCDEDDARVASLFRSSLRQKIIDFIIGSRIRDSGAELGPSTQLGKQVKLRVPLHSHGRLEALYSCWVTFWREPNWNIRDGKSLKVEPESSCSDKWHGAVAGDADRDQNESTQVLSLQQRRQLPSVLYRFFVGSFYQPLDSIEEYYGEKVAFYFAWLQHVSFHLLYLSLVGLIVFWIQFSSGRWDHPIRPWFSIFVVIWSFVVLVTWRKRSNFLAYRWGTLDYKEEEIARPEFKGTEYRVCPITNTYVMYYPPWKRWLMMCISIPLTVGFTFIALVGILIFYGNRDVMLANYFSSGEEQSFVFHFSASAIGQTAPMLAVELTSDHLSDPDFWLIIIGFPTLLGLILPLLNFCLRRISIWLNEIENHRTEAEYRTHFIIKVFAFRFVCYFAALYYYSFIGVSESDAQATEHGIIRVASTLFSYLTVAHWWNICINIFFPLLLYRWRIFRERLHLKKELRSLELKEIEEFGISRHNDMTGEERLEKKKLLLNKRILLEHAQVDLWEEMMLPEHDSFTEYLFAVTQFAYVTCFSVVLPITPLIALFNHLLNMRLDAFKLCRGRRRPLAVQTGGIGVWNHVLHVVTVIAILTNCALMALTSSQLSWLATKIGKLGVFALSIGVEHFLLLVKYIMQLSVSRLPTSVENEIRRKKYDQERKRYRSLRMKKRSKSSYGTKNFGSGEQIEEPYKSDEKLKTSPCPPIQESSTDSSMLTALAEERVQVPTVESKKEQNEVEVLNSKNRGVVNVRALAQHSPLVNENRSYVPKSSDVGNIRRNKYSRRNVRSSNLQENTDPNFDEAIKKLPSGSLNEFATSPFTPHPKSGKKVGTHQNDISNTKSKANLPKLQLNSNSSIDTNSNNSWRPSENVFSPDSSISTVQGLPTPCHLRLESPASMYTTENNFVGSASGYYQHASAPPMSPNHTAETDNADVDDRDVPKAKWAVYHSFQYNQSAQKELRKKKSC